MKTVLSYGAGVNSTAIIALGLLGRIPMPDYIVFSDTGAEWPHTYKYMDYMESKGIRIIYLEGGDCGMTLIEYCREKNFIPSRMNRWCTDRWKITPIKRFCRGLNEEFRIIIGIDAGEAHRARNFRNYQCSPLLELGINRNGCKKVIRKAGLGIPQKSGCFICPYQKKRQWIEMKKYYPELWKVAIDLEKNSIFHHKNFTFVNGMTIKEFVADLDKQEELPFGAILDQRCECLFN